MKRKQRLIPILFFTLIALFSESCSIGTNELEDTISTESTKITQLELELQNQLSTQTPIVEVPLVPTPSPASTNTPLPIPSPTPSSNDQFGVVSANTINDEVKKPNSIEWSPDGNIISIGMARGLLLLDGSDLSIMTHYTTSDFVHELTFSEAGTYLAGAVGDEVIVWDGRTGEVRYEFEDEKADTLQFINDRDLMVGYFFLSHASYMDVTTYRLGEGIVSSVRYNVYDAEPSGPFIFANGGKTLVYWGMYEIQVLERGHNEPSHSYPYGTVLETILNDRVIYSDVRQCALRIYGLDDGQNLGEFAWCDAKDGGERVRDSTGLSLNATKFDFDLERDIVALGHENGEITLWKLSTGELIGRMSVNRIQIHTLRLNPSLPQLAILTRPRVEDPDADRETFLTVWDYGEE